MIIPMKEWKIRKTSHVCLTLHMSLKIRISVILVSRPKDENNKTKKTRIWEATLTTNADPESNSRVIAWYGHCILRQKPQNPLGTAWNSPVIPTSLRVKIQMFGFLQTLLYSSHINTILVYQHLHVHLDTCSSVESPEAFSEWPKEGGHVWIR